MPKEPDNLVLKLLREMRTKLDEVFAKLETVETRVRHVESQLDDLRMTVTYALGQSTETQFRQSKQEARIDELFAQLETLLTAEKPQP
jgi:septal ring factor EnvC (AmiA/AmiB activator)